MYSSSLQGYNKDIPIRFDIKNGASSTMDAVLISSFLYDLMIACRFKGYRIKSFIHIFTSFFFPNKKVVRFYSNHLLILCIATYCNLLLLVKFPMTIISTTYILQIIYFLQSSLYRLYTYPCTFCNSLSCNFII